MRFVLWKVATWTEERTTQHRRHQMGYAQWVEFIDSAIIRAVNCRFRAAIQILFPSYTLICRSTWHIWQTRGTRCTNLNFEGGCASHCRRLCRGHHAMYERAFSGGLSLGGRYPAPFTSPDCDCRHVPAVFAQHAAAPRLALE